MQHLALSALGPDKPGVINELCKLAAHCACSITNCHVIVLNSEFTAHFLLAGSWSALAKFEAALPAIEKSHDLRCMMRRTQVRVPQTDQLPYLIYIVAIEQAHTLHKITQFLTEQAISIYELNVSNYKAPISEIAMLSISIVVSLPINQSIADLRESFILFCDDHNFDAVMEPQKS